MLLQFDAVREAFGINMPQWSDVGFVLLLGFGIMVSVEMAKLVLRRAAGARFDPGVVGRSLRRTGPGACRALA